MISVKDKFIIQYAFCYYKNVCIHVYTVYVCVYECFFQFGETAIMRCAAKGNLRVVKLLLERGANLRLHRRFLPAVRTETK